MSESSVWTGPPTGEFQIVPDAGGRWMVRDSSGGMAIEGQNFDTLIAAFDSLHDLARSKGENILASPRPDGPGAHVLMGPRLRAAPEYVALEVLVPLPVSQLLTSMVPAAGQTKSEVITRAAVLLNYALDVTRQNKRLAVVDDDLNVERELTGIFPGDVDGIN